MKWSTFLLLVWLCGPVVSNAQQQAFPFPDTPKAQPGTIVGTVTDVNNDVVAGATVVLAGPALKGPRTLLSNDSGFFQFGGVAPGTYQVTVTARGFANWASPAITLKPGQYAILPGSKLRIAKAHSTITVSPKSTEEVATEQVRIAEQQRIFGFIPNFYVVYGNNIAPLTPRLKFRLATRVLIDPVTILGVAAVAGFNQAGDIPNYGQGVQGYAKRFGASYATGATDIMIGGAILPSLLHQDPRYFYQGTGSVKSRAWYAVSRAFVCKGDDGRPQPNYSTIGGDLASAAIAVAYYPPSDRGAERYFGSVLLNTGSRALANLAQEFILRRLTPRVADQRSTGQ